MSVIQFSPVYRTDQPLDDRKKRHSFRCVISTWSSVSQVAFTSHLGQDTASTNRWWPDDEHYIHVVDPNKPWDLYSFVSGHTSTITALQWNSSGSKLLSVDNNGIFKLWGMKSGLVNNWQCERTLDIEEKVVCMSWIGISAKYLFGDPPRDLNHLMAQGGSHFPRNKANPLANIYGMTTDGWIAITETGKVCFVSTNADIPVTKTQIDTDLQGIKIGDISFDGNIILGVADGLVSSVARFYKVSLNYTTKNKVNIVCSALQTLSPYSNKSSHPYAITHIKFVYRNSGSHVFICSKGLLESYIERWKLSVEAQQLHELCQKQQPHKKPPPIKNWEFLSQHIVRKHIVSLTVPWLPVEPEKYQSSTYPRHNLILGFADGHIRALNSINLSLEGELKSLDNFNPPAHQAKRLKTSFCGHSNAFLSLHYSPCCCCLLGITGSGSLYLFKCEQNEAVSHIHNSVALKNLLKYCLISGWDCWDVMVVLKHQHEDILTTILRLFEQDYKALPHSQITRRFLSIKAGLLSLFREDSRTKVMDCYSKQFLLALTNFFKSLVPLGAEWLGGRCDQASEIDLDAMFKNLDLSKFEVDAGVLNRLIPLIQWVADLTVSIIGIFLNKQGREIMPGASLRHDNLCILQLKQLLLLVLIWSKQSQGILPYCIGPIENHEYVVHLFKLVSRLWMVNQQALDMTEFENNVSDMESYISNHLDFLYQSMLITPSNQGVTGKQAYLRPDDPDVYEFGEKARDRMLPLRLLTRQYSGNVDIVTKMFVGNDPDTKLRQCTKCDGVSLLTQLADGQPENIWEQKWTASCMCGGAWKAAQPS